MRRIARVRSLALAGCWALVSCGGDASTRPARAGAASLAADLAVHAFTPNLRVRLFAQTAAGNTNIGEQVFPLDTPGSDEVSLDIDLTTCLASTGAATCTLVLSGQMLDPQGQVLDQAQTAAFTLAPGERRVLTDPLVLREVNRLTVAPASVTLEVGQTRQFTVTPLNSLGQTVGRAAPTVTLSPPNVASVSNTLLLTATAGGSTTATFAVGGRSATATIQVLTAPRIIVSQSNVTFGAVVGEVAPRTATISVTNSGQAALTGLAATVGASAPWLSATLSGLDAPATLNLSASPAGLAPGAYTGTVTLNVPVRPDIPPVTVQVLLTIQARPTTISVRPPRVVFNATRGGPNPPQASVVIAEATNLALGGLSIAGAIDSLTGQPADVSWLTFALSSTTAPTTLLLAPNTTQPVGTRRVRLQIASSQAGVTNSPQFLDVRYDVVAADSIVATPTPVTFNAVVGGPLPPAQTVNLTSTGSPISGLNVLSVSQPWLNASLAGTVTPTALQLALNTTNLPPGTNTADVVIRSVASSVVPTTTVRVNVIVSSGTVVSGRVFNGANNNGIGGATVTALLGSATIGTATTDAQGVYTLAVPPGTGYRLSIAAAGFTPASVLGVDVGSTPVNAPAAPLSPSGSVGGQITGQAKSATTGLPIGSGVTIELRTDINNVQGVTVQTTTTNVNGSFAFTNVAPGTYTLLGRATGFANGTAVTVSLSGGSIAQDVLLSPTLGAGAVRIVLTWGTAPPDLDAHITYPLGAGRGWVFFNAPGTCSTDPVCLDVDDVNGSGPETITINTVAAGVHRFYVHNFSDFISPGSGQVQISASNAVVRIFQGSSSVPIQTFSAPQLTGNMWHVFDLSGTTITPVNQMIVFTGSGAPPRIASSTAVPYFLSDHDILQALFQHPPRKTARPTRATR